MCMLEIHINNIIRVCQRACSCMFAYVCVFLHIHAMCKFTWLAKIPPAHHKSHYDYYDYGESEALSPHFLCKVCVVVLLVRCYPAHGDSEHHSITPAVPFGLLYT